MNPADLIAYSHVIAERHAAMMEFVDQIDAAPSNAESSDQQADAYAEALFLRAFTAYESDLEKLFLHYVTGGASLKGSMANSYLRVADETLARRLTRAGWNFLSWAKPEKIRDIVENYIENG